MSNPQNILKAFSHTMFYVMDMERAVQFWTKNFNFEVAYRDTNEYASLIHPQLGTIALHAGANHTDEVGSGGFPYFKVDNIEASVTALKSKNIKTEDITDLGTVKFTQFYDSENNMIGIQQPMH